MAEKYLIRDAVDESTLEVRRDGESFFVRREEGPWREASLERIGGSSLYVLMLDSSPTELFLERRRGGAVVTIGRHTFDYDVAPWRPPASRVTRAKAAAAGVVRIVAPMTGSVIEVRCAPGEAVAAGQVLLVIESMKMNNELRSPVSGTVEAVPAVAGRRVTAGELLVSLQA